MNCAISIHVTYSIVDEFKSLLYKILSLFNRLSLLRNLRSNDTLNSLSVDPLKMVF